MKGIEKIEEFEILYQRALKIYHFFIRIFGENPGTSYDIETLDDLYQKKRITPLRYLNDELTRSLREWDKKDTSVLDNFFIEELGENPPKQKNVR